MGEMAPGLPQTALGASVAMETVTRAPRSFPPAVALTLLSSPADPQRPRVVRGTVATDSTDLILEIHTGTFATQMGKLKFR